jgi:ubiquinone/menaquinone biosynthesis C-methylase UbiE
VAESRYTHGHHESVLRSHRWRTAENSAAFLLPRLKVVDVLLDVGCGPGTISADLARRLTQGRVVAVDRSEAVVADARAEFAAQVGEHLDFRVGDVYQLDFADGTFDVVFAHQILQHLAEPVAALREMRRVLKPGGLVAVRDADFGAFAWAPTQQPLERWRQLYHDVTARNGAQADGGRHLKSWVRAAGFRDLEATSSTWTFENDAERAWWGGLWADRVVDSDFAAQAVEYGLATPAELRDIARSFRSWANDPDGIFIVPHGEVLARR